MAKYVALSTPARPAAVLSRASAMDAPLPACSAVSSEIATVSRTAMPSRPSGRRTVASLRNSARIAAVIVIPPAPSR
jgi:hypothetical protein